MVLPPRLDPGCLMLPCLAKSQLWPQFNFFSASPREPDKSEFGTNPGRQKRGRKSNLMKQRFFWVQMVQKLVLTPSSTFSDFVTLALEDPISW